MIRREHLVDNPVLQCPACGQPLNPEADWVRLSWDRVMPCCRREITPEARAEFADRVRGLWARRGRRAA